jgi:capsular polysaccharide biosynthesis protein
LTEVQRETLEWLGLTSRLRPTPEDHLVVESFYFSSLTNMTGLFDPYAVSFLRRSFLGRRDESYDSPRRFFIHRVNAPRGLTNENEVLRFFETRGWAIVDAAALPLARQIQIFAQAEEVRAARGGFDPSGLGQAAVPGSGTAGG